MTLKTASIIGGGVAGPAVAIALQRINISCTIYELRPSPATIGGAINLSPSACRVLDHFDILPQLSQISYPCSNIEMYSLSTGSNLGSLPFGNIKEYGYESLRVTRSHLQRVMLEAAVAAGVKVFYGSKLVGVEEDGESVFACFEDGTRKGADLLLGCDGIHSAVRMKYVEPERRPVYTGISSACGYAPVAKVKTPIHFKEMGMNMSGQGSLLTTYCDMEKSTLFLAAVMEVKLDAEGKDGWRARGKVVEEVRKSLLQRFETEAIPCIGEMMDAINELFFYPVFTLSNGGTWHKGRVMLIGDAAHAMPPGGSSAGLAFEDAILLSRILDTQKDNHNLEVTFGRYDAFRRPRVMHDWKQKASQWEGTKNHSWWWQKVRETFMWALLPFIAKHMDEQFRYDPMTVALPEQREL